MIWYDISVKLQSGYHPVAVVIYEGGSKSFRPDIQKPCQMENAERDI